jgi:hypothetical protein
MKSEVQHVAFAARHDGGTLAELHRLLCGLVTGNGSVSAALQAAQIFEARTRSGRLGQEATRQVASRSTN